MYIKIYFDEKPLFLCDAMDGELTSLTQHPDTIVIDEFNLPAIHTALHEMQVPAVHAVVLLHPDLAELQKAVWKKFDTVQAAGGLIVNNEKEYLLIFRRGKWDLPKGKLDPGEDLRGCAIREVREETGLERIELISPLLVTYHTYHEGSHFILKESHWYLMQGDGGEALVPQAEEDIRDIQWVAKDDLPNKLNNTFPSIKDVFAAYDLVS